MFTSCEVVYTCIVNIIHAMQFKNDAYITQIMRYMNYNSKYSKYYTDTHQICSQKVNSQSYYCMFSVSGWTMFTNICMFDGQLFSNKRQIFKIKTLYKSIRAMKSKINWKQTAGLLYLECESRIWAVWSNSALALKLKPTASI